MLHFTFEYALQLLKDTLQKGKNWHEKSKEPQEVTSNRTKQKKAQGWVTNSYNIYKINTDFKFALYIVHFFIYLYCHCHIHIALKSI